MLIFNHDFLHNGTPPLHSETSAAPILTGARINNIR